jgi:hypothetical protein
MRAPRRLLPASLAALVLLGPAEAQIKSDLSTYSLFASEALRARKLRVLGGDVGVNGGALVSAGPLEASASQVVADRVRLPGPASCAALFANDASGGGAGCGPATKFQGPVVPDVGRACGFPDAFPACNQAQRIVVQGERSVLSPGTYGDLIVRGGRAPARVVLAGRGRYVFCSIQAGPGTVLELDQPADVFVNGRLRLGAVELAGVLGPPEASDGRVAGDEAPTDVHFFVGGSQVKLGGQVEMQHLCAPRAALTAERAVLRGSFVARRMRLVRSIVVPPAAVPQVNTTTSTTASTTSTTVLPVLRDLGQGVGIAGDLLTSVTLAGDVSPLPSGSSVIVAFVSDPASGGHVNCFDTGSNRYTIDADITYGSGTSGVRLVICSARNIATPLGPGDAVRVLHPAATRHAMSAAAAIDLPPSAVVDRVVRATGNSLTPDTGPTPMTNSDNELLVAAIGAEQSRVTTLAGADAPWTALPIARTANDYSVGVVLESRTVTTPANYSAGGTITTVARPWAAAIVTYRW